MSIEGGNKQPEQVQPTKQDRRAYHKAYNKGYYQKHREKLKARALERYHQNPEPTLARSRKPSQQKSDYQKEWREKNRDWVNERQRGYNRRKKEAKSEGGETVIFTESDYWKSEPAKDTASPPAADS